MGFNTFAEAEPYLGTVEVLLRRFDLKVSVASEVVLEKSQAEFEGDQANGIVETLPDLMPEVNGASVYSL